MADKITKVLGEQILCELVEESAYKQSPSGLIFPASGDKFKKVMILSFGPDANKGNLLKENDVVMVEKCFGRKVKIGNKEYEFHKGCNFIGIVE